MANPNNKGMSFHKLSVYRIVWSTLDAFTIVFAYTVAFFIRTLSPIDIFLDHFWFILLAVVINIAVFGVIGVYQHLWSQTSGNTVRIIVAASLLSTSIILILNTFAFDYLLPTSVVLVGQFSALVISVILRYRSRLIHGLSWRWDMIWHQQYPSAIVRQRILVVGAGSSGQLFVSHTNRLGISNRDYDIIGFADDDHNKQGMLIEGKPVLGQINDIASIVRTNSIDSIVLALHRITGPRFRRIVDICQSTNADVKIMPNLLDLNAQHHATEIRDVQIEDLIGRPSVHNEYRIDISPIDGHVILVTGAAGSVGSELSRQLAKYKPQHLLLLDNNESGLYDLVAELKRINTNVLHLTPILCDVTCEATLERVFLKYKPQVIFHAAAYKHVPLLEVHPHEAIRVNLGGTYTTTRLAQKYNAERFVLISTDKAVNSQSVMGATKFLCEQIVRAQAIINASSSTALTAVRFGNVLGSRGSVVPLFERQIQAGGPVTVTDERMTRYFMSIPEAAHLVIQAGCLTEGNDLFVLEMGESVRILELAERMIRLHNLRPYIDIPIEFIGIRPGETLHEKLIIAGERRFPTAHPFISTYEGPSIDTTRLMTGLDSLLNIDSEMDSDDICQAVISLAQTLQVHYNEEEATN